MQESAPVQSGGYLLFSHEYVAVTADPVAVKSQYFTSAPLNFVIPDVMPAFNIDYGKVKIINDFQYCH